jgi:hypothetical protein
VNHQHVLEIADLGSVDILAKQLLKLMTSNGVGKTSSVRRLKWLEIASIAESRAQLIGQGHASHCTPIVPESSLPLHQLDSDPSQAPVFES